MKRTIVMLFIALILSVCAESVVSAYDYAIEENQDAEKTTYPYVVRSESAVWYLAKDDIDLLGENQYYKGLIDILRYMESDFSDARKELAGYIFDEIPPVVIYTDFCGKAGISEIAGAYYNERSNFIKVFYGWDMAKDALLHEYVHYLTIHCTSSPVTDSFWGEGVAEYISKIICKNRMLRSMNMGFSAEESVFYKEHGAWNEEEECIDPKLFYFGTAQAIAQGQLIGTEYMTVNNIRMVRTPEIQKNPSADKVSFIEAGCLMAYLVDTYTKEEIFTNLAIGPDEIESLVGKSFAEIYENWAEWNTEYCKELEIW